MSGASVCFNNKQIWSYQQTSTIHMNKLNQKQINIYLEKTGKNILYSVGCYQLEKLGPQIIKSIQGDFFNVLGFPLFPFLSFLSKI
jgi:septum formation protein